MYNSLKQILDFAPCEFEGKGLGLTFDGEDVDVTYVNRERYTNLRFQHCYVTCLENQVSSFSHGFDEILLEGSSASSFFSWLELTDIDYMLGGLEEDIISVHQWRKFTVYEGSMMY